MEIGFFFRSMLIGLSIAATIGPMSILCIQRTLQKGYLYGLVSGMGIATADGTYGSIAAFGLTIISTFLINQQTWIRLIGGMFLVYLGTRTLLSSPPERPADDPAGRVSTKARTGTLLGAYTSTYLLTLTNPLTILSFAAIFAGLGVASAIGTGRSYLTATLVVAGVFCGSALWWCILTGSISLLRARFSRTWMAWLNRISGCIIAAFGIVALVSLL